MPIGADIALLPCPFAAHRGAWMATQLQVGVEAGRAPPVAIRDVPAATVALRQPEPAVFDDEGAVVIVDEHQRDVGDAVQSFRKDR